MKLVILAIFGAATVLQLVTSYDNFSGSHLHNSTHLNSTSTPGGRNSTVNGTRSGWGEEIVVKATEQSAIEGVHSWGRQGNSTGTNSTSHVPSSPRNTTRPRTTRRPRPVPSNGTLPRGGLNSTRNGTSFTRSPPRNVTRRPSKPRTSNGTVLNGPKGGRNSTVNGTSVTRRPSRPRPSNGTLPNGPKGGLNSTRNGTSFTRSPARNVTRMPSRPRPSNGTLPNGPKEGRNSTVNGTRSGWGEDLVLNRTARSADYSWEFRRNSTNSTSSVTRSPPRNVTRGPSRPSNGTLPNQRTTWRPIPAPSNGSFPHDGHNSTRNGTRSGWGDDLVVKGTNHSAVETESAWGVGTYFGIKNKNSTQNGTNSGWGEDLVVKPTGESAWGIGDYLRIKNKNATSSH